MTPVTHFARCARIFSAWRFVYRKMLEKCSTMFTRPFSFPALTQKKKKGLTTRGCTVKCTNPPLAFLLIYLTSCRSAASKDYIDAIEHISRQILVIPLCSIYRLDYPFLSKDKGTQNAKPVNVLPFTKSTCKTTHTHVH